MTGANTGVGKSTAQRLAAAGAHVIMACRDEKRCRDAAEDVRRKLTQEGRRASVEGEVVFRREIES